MNGKSLKARLDKIQPHGPRRLCLTAEPEETDMALHQRAAALGYPVMVGPRSCETSQEWARIYGRPA